MDNLINVRLYGNGSRNSRRRAEYIYCDKAPNYIGMRAKLSTCSRTEKYKDYKGNVFHFEGDFLVCENCKSAFNPFSLEESYMKIKVNDSMIVTITDNNQVTDDTVFE